MRLRDGRQSATIPFLLVVMSIKTAQEQHAFEHLVTMAHGDRATAERLVGYEYGRRPDAPGEELIHTAIQQWIRDNR